MAGVSGASTPVIVVDVVGNIGAGKSSLLKEVAARLHGGQLTTAQGTYRVLVLEEPIDKWRCALPTSGASSGVSGVRKSPLQLMYEDPVAHGFAFQLYALQTRLTALLTALLTTASKVESKDESNKPAVRGIIVVCERSCVSRTGDIFGDLMREQMTGLEFIAYQEAREACRLAVAAAIGEARELIVYLRCEPEVCMARILQRGRPEEVVTANDSMPRLLDTLHKEHDARFMASRDDITASDASAASAAMRLDAGPSRSPDTLAAELLEHLTRKL